MVSNLVGTAVRIPAIEGISGNKGRSLGGISLNGFMDRDSNNELDGEYIGKNDVLVNVEGLKISTESI